MNNIELKNEVVSTLNNWLEMEFKYFKNEYQVEDKEQLVSRYGFAFDDNDNKKIYRLNRHDIEKAYLTADKIYDQILQCDGHRWKQMILLLKLMNK